MSLMCVVKGHENVLFLTLYYKEKTQCKILYDHSTGFAIVECLTRDRTRGCGFESHWRQCVVSLSKTHLSLLSTGSTQEDPPQNNCKIVDRDVKNQIKLRNEHKNNVQFRLLFNGIARTLKKLRTSKGDYWIKQ